MRIEFQTNQQQHLTPKTNFGNIASQYTCDYLGFFKDGEPYYIVAGEYHFSRYSHEFWKEELLKMRATGVNVVSTYLFWNYHEKDDGTFDFTGDNDIKRFLAICKEIDMPCILRIGPWCHGEVVHGGFPKRITKMIGTRSDNPKYLEEVKKLYNAYFQEVKDYLDGETVLGIQLENEYTGKIEHLRTLKRIAVETGFRTPFFTMTGWPYGKPDVDFLPLFGGYPDAPWSHLKKALKPSNRFIISKIRNDSDIGSDLFKSEAAKEDVFEGYPICMCETGAGNQITQHRRPKFGEDDGYGVAFSKFASGVNLLGYYMYHGGRNRFEGTPMQESRKTLYPNNLNIIDYDFQSPVSRFGYFRKHGLRLKLLHEFTASFDKEFSRTDTYFPDYTLSGATDISAPRCSVRMKENGEGYFFVTAYDRNMSFPDFKDFEIALNDEKGKFLLPKLDVLKNSMFFYPFRITLSGSYFDYIVAQPISKIETDDEIRYYFSEIVGNTPRYSVKGKEKILTLDKKTEICSCGNKKVCFTVFPYEKSLTYFRFENKEVFTDAAVYQDGAKLVFGVEPTGNIIVDGKTVVIPKANVPEASLKRVSAKKLPWDFYLYSRGTRQYYELKIAPDALQKNDDVKLKFLFVGSSVQLFYGELLIDDLFNYDGTYQIYLKQYAKYLDGKEPLTLKVAPAGRFGIGKYYSEIPVVPGKAELKLLSVTPIIKVEI